MRKKIADKMLFISSFLPENDENASVNVIAANQEALVWAAKFIDGKISGKVCFLELEKIVTRLTTVKDWIDT